ncbi:MAG: hypothetical protein P9L98_01130 [Candidatus Kaelpia imicola]|nr:hypothetical protein [Candidatus Kaelpia imicola]
MKAHKLKIIGLVCLLLVLFVLPADARRIKESETTSAIQWSQELFLKELQEVATRLKTTSSYAFLNDSEGKKVYAAFRYHRREWGYMSWADVLKAVGLEAVRGVSYMSIRWTNESFLHKLKEVATRLETTSSRAFQDDSEGSNTYRAFERYRHEWGYASWADAVRAVGLEPVFSWTREVFIDKFKEVATRLNTTSSSAFQDDSEGQKLYAAFYDHRYEWGYESWGDAVKAAGF